MKTISILSFLLLFTVTLSHGQTDEKYNTTLKKMFEVSGSEESYKMAIKQMITMFKESKPDVPATVWADFEAEFLKTSLADLVNMLAPVYKKHMTLDDLQKLIDFYQTPVGKKYASKAPLIMQESMQVGQQWGMKIGQAMEEKLKQQGVSGPRPPETEKK